MPSTGTISLQWNPVADATQYAVYIGVPGETEGINTGSLTSYQITTGITPNSTYLIYVIAKNVIREIIGSGEIVVTTPDTVPAPPDTDKIVVIGVSSETVSLRWESSSKAEFYRVYVNTATEPVVDNLYDRSAVVGGLLPGTTYSFVISAVNEFGESRANPIRVTTSSYGASDLKPPMLISPNPGFTTVDPTPTLYWQVPDGPDGKKFDFIVEIAEDPDFSKNVRTYNSFVDKTGFSFQSSRNANSKEIVSFKIKDNLVKY